MPYDKCIENYLQIFQNRISVVLLIVLGLFALLANNIIFSEIFAFENATEYKLIKKWGEEGKGEGQFQRPHDLDFSPDEKFYTQLTEMVIEFRHLTKMVHFSFLLGS